MKRIVCILTALLFLLLACQPTPEKEIIVSHDQKQVEAAEPGEPGAALVVPERWEETVDIGFTKIVFEADVRTDDSVTHPVYTIERASFDGKTAQRILEAAYGTCERRENALSREEIIQQIENIRLGAVSAYDYNTHQYISTPIENEEEMLQPYIHDLQEAPVEDTYVSLTAEQLDKYKERIVLRTKNGELIYLYQQKGGVNQIPYLSFHKYFNGLIQTENLVLQGEARVSEPSHTLDNVKLSQEEALTKANDFVKLLGRDDLRCARIEKARILKEFPTISSTRENEDIPEGYKMTFTQAPRGCIPNGCEIRKIHTFLQFEDMQSTYNFSWGQEILSIFVTEEGIASLVWENPMHIVGIREEDVALLPFDQVQERIRTMIEYGIKGSTYISPNEGKVYVTDVYLSAVLRPIKDDNDHAELEPAWVVQMETDLSRHLYEEPYYLILDATDGSLIR